MSDENKKTESITDHSVCQIVGRQPPGLLDLLLHALATCCEKQKQSALHRPITALLRELTCLMELIGLNAAYKSILDRCMNTALFMSFGIGDTENLWQLRQFIGLYSVQQMAMNTEEGNILMGYINSERYTLF